MNDLIPYENPTVPSNPPREEFVFRGFRPPVEEFDLRQLLAILRRRWVLILSVTTVALAATGFLIYRQVPRYRTAAVIRLTDERGAMTSGLEGVAREALGPSDDPLLSQIEVIRTRTVAGRVVDRLGLRLTASDDALPTIDLQGVSVDPTAVAADTLSLRMDASGYAVDDGVSVVQAAYGEPVWIGGVSFVLPGPAQLRRTNLVLRSREEVVDSLLHDLRARAREGTDVVDVEFTSADPATAQRVANSVVEEFQALDARQAQEQSRRRRIFLEEQLAEMDSLHTYAQMELSEFRRQQQVFSSREQYISEQVGLAGLEVRREELNAEREMFASMLAAVESSEDGLSGLLVFASSPGVAENPVTSALFGQLLSYEAARDSLTLGDHGRALTDPDVQRLTGLVSTTRAKLREALAGQVGSIDARVAALDRLRARSRAAMEALPDTEAQETRYVQNVETVRQMADQLREEYQKARIAEAVEGGQVEVLDYATLPLRPIPARRPFKLALGLFVGLMFASGVAVVLDQMDTAIREPDDLEGTLRLPGLAVIPRVVPKGASSGKLSLSRWRAGRKNGRRDRLVTLTDSRSVGAEAYRQLRTNLIFAQALQQLHRILITSATPAEGKSTVVANLGVTFANQGMRVLLIDADLRNPTMHLKLGIPQSPGLAQVIPGTEDVSNAIRKTRLKNLFALPAGTLPPNPAELLGQAPMRSLLARLSADFDLVLIDSPPATAAADARILATMVDGVIMVVRAGSTDREVAQRAIQQITSVGGRMVGAVLNDADAKLRQYGQKYSYHY